MERKVKCGFMIAFWIMILIPLVTTNFEKGKISESENRKLAEFPSFHSEDGGINKNFNSDFETWINDNIGMRSSLVLQNAKIQYYLFNILSNNSDYILGPNGEFNYATESIIKTYQHLDLKNEEILNYMVDGFQFANEYANRKGMQLYYYQCWDKQSIYPEYFPKTVIQHGDMSKTDQIVDNLINKTDVTVISPKQKLIHEKLNYSTYSKWGDPTHWTPRGAYIGYVELMNTVNEHNFDKYKVLNESDYNITVSDKGTTLFGGIHKEELLESFEIKNPKAVLTNDKITLYVGDQRHKFYTNDKAGNRDRVLVLGDSYINSYFIDDLAESFYETIFIYGDYSVDLYKMLDEYNPDILIVENAERCDRTGDFAFGALQIKDIIE